MRDDDLDEASDAGEGEGAGHRSASWHRGDVVNAYPKQAAYLDRNFLRDQILKGWMPQAPLLTRGTRITAFGSCFAANITRHLETLGYDLSRKREPDIHISRIADGLVNTASILGQFEWALENKKQAGDLWHGFKAEGYGYDEDIRLRTRALFLATEFFIVTLGLSEVWYDEVSGGTFWRAVPKDVFDPARHKFRVMSMEETKRDIARIHALIRAHVPNAKILFTVSPIPLAATFRPVSCISANAVSKAVLRAALDEFLREHDDELNRTLFYFPSMEIVQHGFVDAMRPDNRHPPNYVLDVVMKTFEAVYCVGEATLDDAAELWLMFRALNFEQVAARKPASAAGALSAAAAGLQARENAKARETTLNRKRAAPEKPTEQDKTALREQRKQERRAARRARRGEEEG
jgi:hypothetical protein